MYFFFKCSTEKVNVFLHRDLLFLFKQACEEEFWDGRDSCVYVGTSFYVKQV